LTIIYYGNQIYLLQKGSNNFTILMYPLGNIKSIKKPIEILVFME
jgi:hypothetical protein